MPRKITILLVIGLFCITCVENLIFIQIYPDGKAYLKFESIGDSTDIFDTDFTHPDTSLNWVSSYTNIDIKNKNNIIHTSEIWLKEPQYDFIDPLESPLGYKIEQKVNKSFFSTNYEFALIFAGRKIKKEYPKLYTALVSKKNDSLEWFPETFSILMQKGINDLVNNSLIKKDPVFYQRIINHVRNSLERKKTVSGLDSIENKKLEYLINTLKPFKINKDICSLIVKSMENHQKKLNTSINLRDDTFIIKLLMPGYISMTNANYINEDTLFWNFGVDSILHNDFELNAQSSVYTTNSFQKTLIFFLLFVFFAIVFLMRKNIS